MKHYHCPVNGWDCPYYKDEPHHPCVCILENPYEECDDFSSMYDEGEEYWDDHECRLIKDAEFKYNADNLSEWVE